LKFINNFKEITSLAINISVLDIPESLKENGIFSVTSFQKIASGDSNTMIASMPYFTVKQKAILLTY
jgi:hypothetical protein